MFSRKSELLIRLTAIFSLLFLFTPKSRAKSLYVVMHNTLYINAYKIQGSSLQYQTATLWPWSGPFTYPVGITLDPCSGYAFLTGESSYYVDLLNARTMIFEENPAATLTGVGAGIVFDKNRQKLYVVERSTQNLFIYLWKPELKTLFPEDETYKILAGILPPPGAYGIDLDKMKGELYVTDSTNTVYRYDTNTWELKGNITISTDHNQAVGITIDSKRRYMYTGSFTGAGGSHTYLVRTDINDPNNPTFSEKNAGAYVIGLAMDEDTGYLYVGTAKQDFTEYNIRVYNTLTWPSDPCSVLSSGVNGPAGMCLGDNIEYKPPTFSFSKVDVNSPNSVVPGNNITYRITYGPGGVEHNNVVITDFLAGEVNYLSSDGNYNPTNRTVTWNKGYISAGAGNNSVDINVQVNNGAAPGGVITNYCEIESDVAYNTATASTNVDFWEPNSSIIYVDWLSPCSPGTGMSWPYAYRDLQDALDSAASGRGSQIWVADGIYWPSILDPCDPYASTPTFVIYRGIPVYGRFFGNEMSFSQRNLNDPNNQSILNRASNSSEYIVSVSNKDSNNVLDGFTIRWASYAGVRINDANLYIANCILTANDNGITAQNSNFTVFDCNISSNGNNGIDATYSYFTITGSIIQNHGSFGISENFYNIPSVCKTSVKNNIIRNNQGSGINFQNVKSPVDILNNLINNNYNGISFSTPIGNDYNMIIQNNTVVKNTNDGIYAFYSYSSSIIRNCIIWGNYKGIDDDYISKALLTYCCIEGNYPGQGNISDNPCFVGYDTNDFHLQYASPCIDTGDPNANYDGQTDIDGQCRVIFGKSAQRADRGADEYFTKADFNGDSIVNFADFAILAAVWKSNNSPSISLDDDNDIDIYDMNEFCENWLWYAPCFPLYEMLTEQSERDSGMAASTELVEQTPPAETVEEPENNASAVTEETTEGITQPISDEQIQILIDWAEQIWQADPELQEMIDPNDYQHFIDLLHEELND